MEVAATGVFLNPDDAMRAVEVRDFLGGQGWFDLVPHRLSPDHPFTMHWSRLVDLPLAALVRGFGLVLPPASAEMAMRLTAPALLFVAALLALLSLVRSLLPRSAQLPAALLFAGSAEAVANFIPGHIHHHGIQAALLLGATALLVGALRPQAGWRPAAAAGALAALSLGVGLQNLPFVLGLPTAAAGAWAWRGRAAAALLGGFGGGLAATAVAVYLLDVPPSAYGAGACDAFSTAHLLAALVGGGAALALAALSPDHRPARFAGLALAGGLLLGSLRAVYPACLHDPMAGVDPLLAARWLADVGEALPLHRLIALDPAGGIALSLTLACGMLATLEALRAAPPATRDRWAALLLLAAIGVVGTLYQVRVAASACALLVPGVAWAVLAAYRRLAARPGRPALLVATVVGLCGNGAAWTAMAPAAARLLNPAAATAATIPTADPASCFQPAAYVPLGALPPGLVLSTIDPGSAVLAATGHSVLAAPYHRNTYGNRVALLAFAAPADEARALVADSHATYLALCRASNEAAAAAHEHPGGLAAALLAGRPPDWLIPLGTGREPILLFRVAQSGQAAGARTSRIAG